MSQPDGGGSLALVPVCLNINEVDNEMEQLHDFSLKTVSMTFAPSIILQSFLQRVTVMLQNHMFTRNSLMERLFTKTMV